MIKGSKDSIVIVGFGWVGQANALALSRLGYMVSYYDVVAPPRHYSADYYSLYEQVKPIDNLLAKDGADTWYVVCIGDRVSDEGEQDITLIERALDDLRAAKGKVILRSTILPGSLERLPFHYYFPEFLHEHYAVEEALHPYYFVLGARQSGDLPEFLSVWRSRAVAVFLGTPEECAYIKYLSNIWNAVRIAFVNEFGDAIAAPRTEAGRVKIENIVDFIFERKSYLRYGRSFGGHCLPKDLRAFVRFAEGAKAVSFMRGALLANADHEAVEREFRTLPQWFSGWDYRQLRISSFATRLTHVFVNSSMGKILRRLAAPMVRRIELFLPAATLAQTKKKWSELGRANPYYYAYPEAKKGRAVDEFDIRLSGQEDYRRYVAEDDLVREIIQRGSGATALEIGCGVGRMTEFFVRDFGRVTGVDVSATLLAVAKRRLSGQPVTLVENDGKSLPVPDASADFIFSYLTFKHLQSQILVADYFADIARVLKPGGLAKVQVRTGPTLHRWQWFYGVSLLPDSACGLAGQSGLTVVKSEIENKKSLWLWLRRPDQSRA